MDTVARKRISYRMQLYLANLTHNGHFFYYDSYFVIIMNALQESTAREIMDGFAKRTKQKMPDQKSWIGVSSRVTDISNLHIAYKRAVAAVSMARSADKGIQYFDEMGTYRLLYSVEDKLLLEELSEEPLKPLLDYDRAHGADYVDTLEMYLIHGGSIKAVAEDMFIHRNTIMYRMENIKKMLGSTLKSPGERMKYLLACMIYKNNIAE